MDGTRCRFGVLVLARAGAAFAPAPAVAGDGAISGTVTDATSLVLPGVSVAARGTLGGQILTAASDGAGQFAIGGLVAGAYEFTFTLPGFQTAVGGSGVRWGLGPPRPSTSKWRR